MARETRNKVLNKNSGISVLKILNNQREHPRETFRIPSRIVLQRGEILGHSQDISLGGLTLILESQEFPIGTPLTLHFSFEKTSYLIISGMIVSSTQETQPPPSTFRVGIKFSGLREFDKKVLQSAIQEFQEDSPSLSQSALDISISEDELAIHAGELSRSYYTSPSIPPHTLKEQKNPRYRTRRADLIPKPKLSNSLETAAQLRREWLSKKTSADFTHIGHYSAKADTMVGNIENFIGMTQVPLGIAGPLQVNGQYANGMFYVPMATTEGALIYTYTHGMLLGALAGGISTSILKDETHLSPMFTFPRLKDAESFVDWIHQHVPEIKYQAESTTKYGKLERLEPQIFDRNVVVKFSYTTGDAMGLNMITFATEKACQFITTEVKVDRYYLQSNFSSIKKPTFHNLSHGFGKKVVADILIPQSLIKRLFHISSKEIIDYYNSVTLTTTHAGMMGITGHTANAIASIFLACGQDVASTVDSSIGITNFELHHDDALYVSCSLPCLQVGTIGGGTALATQQECLRLLGCFGKGKSKKLAEIIAATALCGEIAICAKIAGGTFPQAHRKYGRKPLLKT